MSKPSSPAAASVAVDDGDDAGTPETAAVDDLQSMSKWELIKAGKWPRILSKDAIIAPEGFNRFLAVPSSFLVQLSIGSVYAFSMWNAPWTKDIGVVAAAAGDWSLQEILPVFSVSAVALGATTFLLGPWAERAGPRFSATAAAISYSSAFAVSGLALATHSLPLLYLGYGLLGGIGWGFGYISPVSTLMKWFPDRRGLAAGLALTAFGGGAVIAAPVIQTLNDIYFIAPEYLGPASVIDLSTVDGTLFASTDSGVKEVVVATQADVEKLPGDLSEGVYVANTGSTGAFKSMLTLSTLYGGSMLLGALGNRVPREGWAPAGYTPPADDDPQGLVTKHNVHHETALKTPQFYLMWTAVMGNAVSGMAILTSAKTIMSDVFGAGLPLVVTGTFATSYVAALSASNAAGRLGWAAASDKLGRKNTYMLFGLGIPTAAMVPYLTQSFMGEPNTAALYLFCFGTMGMISVYGGLFSVLPAYIDNVFGSKHVGAIHGRMLTAWSAAAVLGPNMLGYMRSHSETSAVQDLASKIDPAKFQETFNAPVSDLSQLLQAKTVTIPRLMELAPPGTMDPTPLLYNTTMYGISGMLSVALLANIMIKPVDKKYHMKD